MMNNIPVHYSRNLTRVRGERDINGSPGSGNPVVTATVFISWKWSMGTGKFL